MYTNVSWISPLDPKSLTHRVHYSDGKKATISVASSAHNLIGTYRRVGIFDYVHVETGRVVQRRNARTVVDGEFRRATQLEYDRWMHGQWGYSGNALVYEVYLMS